MLTIIKLKAVSTIIMVVILTVFFSTTVLSEESKLAYLEEGINQLIYDLASSVVTIETSEPVYPNNYSGAQDEVIYSFVSTGVVYDTLGRILTLASSVKDKSLIAVKFEDRTIPAEVLAIDYQTGLAVLQLFKPFGTPVKLSSKSGCAGQIILTLGNSYGLRASPSLGFCNGTRPDGLMQFSSNFTAESYGGGLFSLSGEMVGIIAGVVDSPNQNGIGLSIPSAKIKETCEYLINIGDRQAGYIGLTTAEIEIYPPIEIGPTSQLSLARPNSKVIDRGVIITDVVPYSPAAKSGLKVGDILYEADSREINSAAELAKTVLESQPGRVINLTFIRHNSPLNLDVRIGQRQLDAFTNSVSDNSFSTPEDLVTDSILKEITRLKKSILFLENRLKQLK